MDFIKLIVNFLRIGKPSHINTTGAGTSSDYTTPTLDNVGQNWLSYLSQPYETQWTSFDQDNCTSRGIIENIEAHLNYRLKNNLLPDFIIEFLKPFQNAQGYVKISKRYMAKMAGTDPIQGVSIMQALNGLNTYGFVPSVAYPDPPVPFTSEEYYQDVPTDIVNFGMNMAKTFHWTWKVLWNNNWNPPNIDTLRNALKSSPVTFASNLGIDYGKVGVVEQRNDKKVYQHTRLIYGVDNYLDVLDSYTAHSLEQLSQNCPLACAIIFDLKLGNNPN